MRHPFVVGIAGGSGSGKTTLAHTICEILGQDQAIRIEHDAYYHDLSHLDPEERAIVNFDHPRALDNGLLLSHLGALRAGRAVPAMRYCYASHTRMEVVDVHEPRAVVIIEGILVLSVAELRAALDLAVFVDTASDLRFVRRLRRDVAERGRSVESVCTQYLDSVRPMHEEFVAPAKSTARLVVSGVGPVEEAAKSVIRAVDRLRPGAAARRGSHDASGA